MNAKMYLFINKGLGMSPGKIAAQAGHAAVEAALLSQTDYAPPYGASPDAELWQNWREGLHYAKYVMEAESQQQLQNIERYLIDRGFRTALIIDEGRTEIAPLTITALGVALVDGDDPHTKATFSSFKLYRDVKPRDPSAPDYVRHYSEPLTTYEPIRITEEENRRKIRDFLFPRLRHVKNDDGDTNADTIGLGS